jgi:hypothetical protein
VNQLLLSFQAGIADSIPVIPISNGIPLLPRYIQQVIHHCFQ